MLGGRAISPTIPLAVAILLSALLAREFVATHAPRPDDAPSPAPAAPASTVPEQKRGPDASSAVALARPMFSPGRRPPTSARAQAAPTPSATPPRVAGILVSAGERIAILLPEGASAGLVAREGSEVAGYTVQAIAAGRVTLLGPDGPLIMQPSAGGPPSTAPGPTTPKAPVPPSINED